MKWQPIETAPKGGGAELITDPKWVDPPKILLLFEGGEQAVCYWSWYYAIGGAGYREGISAWVDGVSGENIVFHYDDPTHWMPLPEPPEDGGQFSCPPGIGGGGLSPNDWAVKYRDS